MANNALLVLLLTSWVVDFAHAAPVILPGRRWIYRHPNLGLCLWFGLFIASVIAAAAAVVIAVLSVFATWLELQRTGVGESDWVLALTVSFAPWLILAFGGILLALVNTKLERAFQEAPRVELGLLGGKEVGRVSGFRIIELPLEFNYLGSSYSDKAVIRTKGSVRELSESELQACTEHEVAHLKARHGLMLRALAFVQQSLGVFGASRVMANEVRVLIELAADRKVEDRVAARSALLKLVGEKPDREARLRLAFLGE